MDELASKLTKTELELVMAQNDLQSCQQRHKSLETENAKAK